MSVIGRIRARRRSAQAAPRFVADERFSVVEDGDTLVVTGEVDIATAPALRAALAPRVATGGLVLLDLAPVTFMDSSGLAALMEVSRDLDAHGGRLALIAPSTPVRLLLDVTGLDSMLHVHATRDEARAG